jgi:hypothetical protein
MTTKQYDAYSDLITFTRASTGTALRRVGYSPELVTNGTFDTDTDWTKVGTTTISGGQATLASAFAYIDQPITISNGSVVRVSYEVVSNTSPSGNLALSNGGFTNATVFITDTVGTHTLDVVVGDATKPLRLIIAKASTVVLDNVSVKEVIFDRATDPLVLFNHPTNVPRIEYDADGNRKGLLIEEARTNLLTYSEDLSNAAWDKSRCTVALGGVGPDGAASLYTATATETNTNGMTVQDSVTISSGATTTLSGYARKGTNDWVLVIAFDGSSNGVRQWFNLATGAVGSSNTFGTGFSKVSASITEQGSGLYRWSFTAATTGTNFRVAINPSAPADLDFDCTIGDVGYVGFVQIEAGSFPTSYISTAGAAASRSADVASIPTSAFGFNPDKGTVVVEAIVGQDAFAGIATLQDGVASINERVSILRTSSTAIETVIATLAGSQAQQFESIASDNSQVKAAITFKTNSVNSSFNGNIEVEDTSAAMPTTISVLMLGRYGGGTYLNGHIKSIQYYPRRLTNTQLQELTS